MVQAKQRSTELLSFKQLQTAVASDVVEQLTAYVADRHDSAQAKLAAETTIYWFARKRWGDYCSQDVRAKLHANPVTESLSVPLERISAVTACMNRNSHILDTLPTWIASGRFEEIIIVDYGSLQPLDETLAQAGLLDHQHIRIIRVEAEKWCLAEAFNVGLLQAKAPFTMKLDADTMICGQADMSLRLSAKQFRTGNWRTFENNVLNGVVLAPTDAIKRTGGYNEQIRHYGWDDCDFYERLSELALVKTDLVEHEFCSLEHSDDERVAHSDALAQANEINRLIQGNRVLTNLLPKWTDKAKRQFGFDSLGDDGKNLIGMICDFSYKISKIQDDYLYSDDGTYEYKAMLQDIAAQISGSREEHRSASHAERSPIILMVSLYEDQAETRRHEMIRCLRINAQLFDHIIILYEQPTAKTDFAEVSVADELTRLSKLNSFDKQLADIEVVHITERPTYKDFFEISRKKQQEHNQPWFVIANSDIAFDNSIERIHDISNPDDALIWLSRWDKTAQRSCKHSSECYLDADGNTWALIESEANGASIPNYLSADAWLYTQEPEDWIDYDYKLGTYFCDSFFANRAFRSNRRVINPCLSIRCFHHHDETNKSSAQKFEDKTKIEQLYSEEQKRLSGDEPVAGVQWTTVDYANSSYLKPKPYRWNPGGGLWLRLGFAVNVASTLLIIEAALSATEASGEDLFVSLICDDRYAATVGMVIEFANYLRNPRLFLDLRQGVFDPSLSTGLQSLSLPISAETNYSHWKEIAKCITTYVQNHQNAAYNDRTHLALSRLLSIKALYSVGFLAERHESLFKSLLLEATYANQLASCYSSATGESKPKFSLIASVFNAKKYLPRLLENFEAIASLGTCELVIVDVNRDNTDGDIIQAFIDHSDYGTTVQYIKLEQDPGIYGCWMKAIAMARSPLISNFNADDRRSPIHPHVLAEYLEMNSDVDVCFTALKPTTVANLGWYEQYEDESWFHWYEEGRTFSLEDFVVNSDGVYCSQNIAHCMPMWRKSLHEAVGCIREDLYGTSADWAFWLECLKRGRKLALARNIPCGLYYRSPTSHNRINDSDGNLENKILRHYYGIEQSAFIQQ